MVDLAWRVVQEVRMEPTSHEEGVGAGSVAAEFTRGRDGDTRR